MKIDQVKTKNELIEFVKFPFKLYKESKYWVPPIIKEEVNSFTKGVNPNLDNCDVNLYVAKSKSKIVGRIAIIINWYGLILLMI
jgi:hypothetical protein